MQVRLRWSGLQPWVEQARSSLVLVVFIVVFIKEAPTAFGGRSANVLQGVILLIVGAGLVAASIVTGMGKRDFVSGSAAAPGVVVRLNAGGSHPQIEFTTPSGQKISYPQGGLIFGYREGDQVRVLYRPSDPAGTACVDAFGALWFVPMLLAIIGLLCFVGGVLSIVGRTPPAGP
jgi:hypothetical protein